MFPQSATCICTTRLYKMTLMTSGPALLLSSPDMRTHVEAHPRCAVPCVRQHACYSRIIGGRSSLQKQVRSGKSCPSASWLTPRGWSTKELGLSCVRLQLCVQDIAGLGEIKWNPPIGSATAVSRETFRLLLKQPHCLGLRVQCVEL